MKTYVVYLIKENGVIMYAGYSDNFDGDYKTRKTYYCLTL